MAGRRAGRPSRYLPGRLSPEAAAPSAMPLAAPILRLRRLRYFFTASTQMFSRGDLVFQRKSIHDRPEAKLVFGSVEQIGIAEIDGREQEVPAPRSIGAGECMQQLADPPLLLLPAQGSESCALHLTRL